MISKNTENIHEDLRGKLISLSGKNFNINIKRTFIIHSKKSGIIRGNHAHKKCRQILCLLNGSALVRLIKKNTKPKSVLFNKIGMIIDVKPKNWLNIKLIKKNTIILVLCDREYEKNDYIYDIKKL